MSARVLIVDDDPVQRRLLDNMVRKFGHESAIAESGDQAAKLLTNGERFDWEGHPKSITTLHPIAAGDMYGIKGIDHLAKKGLIQTIIAGSFPSGPSSLPMPDIWHLITDNDIRAYNLPSGVLFEIATIGPGFTVDEPLEHLGEKLSLPPAFEHLREEVEPRLRPVENPRVKTQG